MKAQEIADLSKVVAEAVRQVEGIFEHSPVTSVRPGVSAPLEHAYRQLDLARLALDAASYAIAHAYLVDAGGRA